PPLRSQTSTNYLTSFWQLRHADAPRFESRESLEELRIQFHSTFWYISLPVSPGVTTFGIAYQAGPRCGSQQVLAQVGDPRKLLTRGLSFSQKEAPLRK